MATRNNNDVPEAGRGRRGSKNITPRPQVPPRARKELGIGTFAGLFCAEAMSSMRLFSLGEHAGFPWFLAWLLPGALDVYALTMVRFFSLLPADHPLRRKAAREAALALAITVLCNALEEIDEAFVQQLPAWAPRLLFVLISALAPFVAYRLIHFRAEIGSDAGAVSGTVAAPAPKAGAGTDTPAVGNETVKPPLDRQPPTETGIGNPATGNPEDPTTRIGNPATQTGKPPVNDNPSDRQAQTGNPIPGNPSDRQKPAVKQPAAGQPSTDTWVEIGKPLYDRLRIELGKRPGETKFHAYLSECVAELIEDGVPVGANKDESPEVYANPSLSTAKRIRKEIEDRFPGIVFGHAQDAAEGQLDLTEEAAS